MLSEPDEPPLLPPEDEPEELPLELPPEPLLSDEDTVDPPEDPEDPPLSLVEVVDELPAPAAGSEFKLLPLVELEDEEEELVDEPPPKLPSVPPTVKPTAMSFSGLAPAPAVPVCVFADCVVSVDEVLELDVVEVVVLTVAVGVTVWVVATIALSTCVTAGWTFDAAAGTSDRVLPVMASTIVKFPPTVTSRAPARVVRFAFPPAAMTALAPVRFAPV